MKNPYESQSRNKFWKTAVSSIKQNDGFQDLWNPKFQITKESKISTLGSCFAQHISHWLTENEYSWQNFETAPNNLSNDELSDYGYGIYSCRVGNIYTPSMLRQWLQLAKNGELSFDEVYEDDGKYFDPLRPQIPKYGHLSMAELNTDRFNTLQALNRLFNESDVFIFTMGLTEAWVDTNGVVYQVCPGTVKGEFNPEIHKFKNYTYDEVLSDMIFVIDAITKINDKIKFLLTVSPVPLTATASQYHVLPATVYSKSVLRAVAGDLSKLYDNVDYFPSYELIATNYLRNSYWEDNLRSVKPEGVEYVMRHFGLGIGAFSTDIFLGSKKNYSSAEEYCDELLMENWNKLDRDANRIEFFLIGDSHMGKLSKAFSALRIDHCGGMIMNGSAWTSNLVHLDEKELFVPLENAESKKI